MLECRFNKTTHVIIIIFQAFAQNRPSGNKQGFGYGSVLASVKRLDHPSTLGIGGIGCDTAPGGASAHGDVRRLTPGIVAWAAELTPGTPLR